MSSTVLNSSKSSAPTAGTRSLGEIEADIRQTLAEAVALKHGPSSKLRFRDRLDWTTGLLLGGSILILFADVVYPITQALSA